MSRMPASGRLSRISRLFTAIDGRFKLRSKILIAFVAIVLIPSVCIGFFSFRKSSSIIEEQTSRAYLEALRQTGINISYRLTEVENISEIIYTNEQLQQILRRANNGQLTIGNVIDDYKAITEITRNLEKSRNILRIRLLIPNDPLYTTENLNIFPVSAGELSRLDEELSRHAGAMEWRYLGPVTYLGNTDSNTIVSLYRPMKNFEDVRQTLGVVALDVNVKTLADVLQNMNLSLPYRALLYKNDSLVSSYTRMPEQFPDDNAAVQAALGSDSTPGQDYHTVRLQGKEYLLLMSRIENADWKLAVLVPAVNITNQSKLLGVYILLLSLSVAVLAIALSVLLSRRFTARIHILADKMKGIEQGRFGDVVTVSGNDEISQLQRRFNKMSTQIKSLIDEVYTITINKQREELKVLEGRINSHFLYNTLDTVKWMALKSRVPDIAVVVTNLSRFFRISLNRGQETITVEKELEHVQAYVDIQNIRFSGAIRYTAAIDPLLARMEMPKLILQPVVENAIIHGINKNRGKSGAIVLRGRRLGEMIEFVVSDNGVGMSRAAAEALLSSESPGYGLRNVHQRLQLAGGPGSGVKIRSAPGAGTVVRLRLQVTPVKDTPASK